MANANKPMGLSPVQYLNGAPWTGGGRIYSIAAGYATALYVGDPVVSSGTSDVAGIQGIAIYGGTGAIRGVIVGLGLNPTMLADPNNLNTIYRPASDAREWYALVVDDPNVIFEVQEHVNGTTLSAGDIGANTTLQSGTGNGFYSGWTLSSYSDAAPTTTATLPIRLMGLSQRIDNAFGTYAKHLVKINVHELGTGTGAAGV